MKNEPEKGYPVASVTPEQVEKIRALESTLTREQGKNVVLIAYEEK